MLSTLSPGTLRPTPLISIASALGRTHNQSSNPRRQKRAESFPVWRKRARISVPRRQGGKDMKSSLRRFGERGVGKMGKIALDSAGLAVPRDKS